MFSMAEKQKIAAAVEKVLLDLNHPEMPKSNPQFELYVEGEEGWSFAEIKPNWMFTKENPPAINPFNERPR